MDKGAIKNYAVWARRRLIEDITQKAFEIGVTEGGIAEAVRVSSDAAQVNGRLLNKRQARQRESLVKRVKEKGFDQVMEEAAYTWFNRIIAIRFMEVNGYLPTGVRVLSSTVPGQAVPDIVINALHLDLDLDLDLVHTYLDKHDDDELFRYLFTRQCNKLNEILPGLFEKIEDYAELLLPNNLLIEGSVIRRLVSDIPEEDFQDQVEIIGWLYQYYNDERRNEVININKGIVKKEDIPAATQLFTTGWVVRYMIDNSLGRYWLERNPNSFLKSKLKYLLSDDILLVDEKVSPESLTLFDPCMGSGHILVYAFEVLMLIYEECGYTQRAAAQLIVKNNLFGIDIDDRAYQLAYFALMMKARQYDRRFFSRDIVPHLCSIKESNEIKDFENFSGRLNFDALHKETVSYLIRIFRDAKEFGSILDVEQRDYSGLNAYIYMLQKDGTSDLFTSTWLHNFSSLIPELTMQAKILSAQYDIVATNPPYLNKMSAKLKDFVNEHYKDYSGDLFSVFIYRNFGFCKNNGYSAFMSPFVWMFIKSYEKLRAYIIQNKSISSLIQMEYSAFEEATVPICTFVLKNTTENQPGSYIKLSEFKGGMEVQRQKVLEAISNKNCKYFYLTKTENISKIPGMPIAYWASKAILKCFDNDPINSIATTRKGMATGLNEKFVRFWYELQFQTIGFNMERNEASLSNLKWFPYANGGNYRKWYGNYCDVVNWENDGYKLQTEKHDDGHRIRAVNLNLEYIFKEGISWTSITSSKNSMRLLPKGFLFSSASNAMFVKEQHYFLGLLNSIVYPIISKIINPTLNSNPGDIGKFPLITSDKYKPQIDKLVDQSIIISKTDWDSFEVSWDFKCHPFINYKNNRLLSDSFVNWVTFKEIQFAQLKANEEELNCIFIDIYGLQDELMPNVDDKDIAIKKANIVREVKSFISYSVGCMLGRYSVDAEGQIFAGGDWQDKWQDGKVRKIKKDDDGNIVSDIWVNATFLPDEDNVLPILDDEYFDDDIVARFIQFLRVTFSEETLEENLDFTADALGRRSSETSRQAIRRYFLKDFFKDHVKVYQKRPIYWLFDSGREDGFKALIYMHRYDEFTVARVRTDYLHRLQRAYEAEARRLEVLIDSDVSPREKTAARKKREKLLKQMQECLAYDQVIAHVANQRIKIDLDDGVKVNYAKFQGIEVPQGDGQKSLKADLLAKI